MKVISVLGVFWGLMLCMQSELYGKITDRILVKGDGVVVSEEDVAIGSKILIPPHFKTTPDQVQRVVLMNRLFALEAKKNGLDDKAFQKKAELIYEKMLADVYRKKIKSTILMDENVLKSYYLANPDEFKRPARYRFKMIRVDEKKDAANILSLLEQGADFETLAREKNPDGKSGDMRWVPENRVSPALRTNLETCELKKLCGPLSVDSKWVVLYVDDVKKTEMVEFDQVKQKIGDKLIRKNLAMEINNVFEHMMKELHVQPVMD